MKKSIWKSLIIPVLFFIYTINLSGKGNVRSIAPKVYEISEFVAQSSVMTNYAIILILILIGGFTLKSNKGKVFAPMFFFSSAYFVLFFHSLLFKEDVTRYIILAVSPILVVLGISCLTRNITNDELTKLIPGSLWAFVLITAFISFSNYSEHPRISGYLDNPNALGATLLGTIVLYKVSVRSNRFLFVLYAVIAFVLIVLTGSRLTTFGFIALVLLTVNKSVFGKKRMMHIIAMSFLLVPVVILSLESIENMDVRAFRVSAKGSDAERSDIANLAKNIILQNPIAGYGANISEVIKAENTHNSYLRVFAMVGVPFGIVFFCLYFLAIYYMFRCKGVDRYIKAYFVCVPLLFIAEDYVVTISGTFFFYYIVFILIAMNQNEELRSRSATKRLAL